MGAVLEALSNIKNKSDTSSNTTVLKGDVSLNGFANAIKSGKVKRIITMAGAGISTSCGIPEFGRYLQFDSPR